MEKFKKHRIVVKEWKEMAADYPVDSFGDINAPGADFVEEMADFCGAVGYFTCEKDFEDLEPEDRIIIHFVDEELQEVQNDEDFIFTVAMVKQLKEDCTNKAEAETEPNTTKNRTDIYVSKANTILSVTEEQMNLIRTLADLNIINLADFQHFDKVIRIEP